MITYFYDNFRKITDATRRFEEFLPIKQEKVRLKEELSAVKILYESEKPDLIGHFRT